MISSLSTLFAHEGSKVERAAVVSDLRGGTYFDRLAAVIDELRAAGVAVTTVRYDGITHDFMMLNPLSGTHATRAAIAQAISVLRNALQGDIA